MQWIFLNRFHKRRVWKHRKLSISCVSSRLVDDSSYFSLSKGNRVPQDSDLKKFVETGFNIQRIRFVAVICLKKNSKPLVLPCTLVNRDLTLYTAKRWLKIFKNIVIMFLHATRFFFFFWINRLIRHTFFWEKLGMCLKKLNYSHWLLEIENRGCTIKI